MVIICCGKQKRHGDDEAKLFDINAGEVRNYALHLAEFSPKTVVCLATPPVSAMVPLVSEVPTYFLNLT